VCDAVALERHHVAAVRPHAFTEQQGQWVQVGVQEPVTQTIINVADKTIC